MDLLLLREVVRLLIVVPSLLMQVSILVPGRNLLRDFERSKRSRVDGKRILLLLKGRRGRIGGR